MRSFLTLGFVFLFVFSNAQEGTRTATEAKTAARIMIVPFEPKLYMSEIDQKVNLETKWKFEQIRENFRHQLDNQLKQKIQSTKPVISFYSDSAKMSKDLQYIYNSTNITFEKIDKSAKPTAEDEKKIKNGQLAVSINNDLKYTNTAVKEAEMLGYLNKKYNAEHFLFVNELDIRTVPESYDLASDSYKREVVVHYTILDKSGKVLHAGLSRSLFSSKENNPKKIVSSAFSSVASAIASNYAAAVKPVVPKK
ncbi:MAG: hypothetical protein M3R27_03870 [Bacteroidota bacterium]|nr:hypothetical protein [Bacteroidota bacterium]